LGKLLGSLFVLGDFDAFERKERLMAPRFACWEKIRRIYINATA